MAFRHLRRIEIDDDRFLHGGIEQLDLEILGMDVNDHETGSWLGVFIKMGLSCHDFKTFIELMQVHVTRPARETEPAPCQGQSWTR